MHVAVAQFAATTDKAANLVAISKHVEEAVALGAQLVVFPENAMYANGDPTADIRADTEALDGDFGTAIATLARQYGIAVVAGMTERPTTPEGREELYPVVLRIATKVTVVSRCARGIDSRGLHRTNLAALREALLKVACEDCICLSDGFPVGDLQGHRGRAIVDGDCTSAAIAAASIVAKVTRDRFMRRADALHPGWEFASHVGYSTPEHRDAIQRLGVSPLHRLSFQSTAYQQLAL